MSMTLTQKDWLLISAYLDGRLNDADKTAFESRLETDTVLKSAFHEIQYTRKMLRSLPQKRAPRNFTLSAEYAKKRSLKWGLNRFFGLASAVSAVALAAIFAWSNLFVFQAKMSAPAPMLAAAPQAAMDSAVANESTSSAPVIITWGQQPGRGGGGGGGDAASLATGMDGYGGGVPIGAEPKLATSAPTESPMMSSDLAATPDPSTLILGLPDPGTEGEIIQQTTPETRSFAPSSQLQPSMIWMIGLGAGAFIFALLAIFLRKR